MPEIYRLVHVAYLCEPILVYGEHELRSREGAQQGDSLGLLKFCEAILPPSINQSINQEFLKWPK